jgi:transposase
MSLVESTRAEGNGAGHPGAQRAVGELRAGGAAEAGPWPLPDPELKERSHRRRRYSAEYKLRILAEADSLTLPGEVGALLRREGLYSSHLSSWRKQREEGAFLALSRPRGRKPADPLLAECAQLRRRAERAEAELAKARRVIEVQGKVFALLEELTEPRGAKIDKHTER